MRAAPVAQPEPTAVVAIVGRPNVGKSTLFNRVVRARRAIVDDVPGVTRDRVTAPATHAGRRFMLVDTGGFAAAPGRDQATMDAQVRAQTLAAVDEADCVVCVLDGAAGLAPADRDTVRFLAKSGKPVFFAVNKLDTPTRALQLADFYALGAEPLFPVSAAHNRGVDKLLDAIVRRLPKLEDRPGTDEATRLALMGRPNVGKSSLLNQLLGTTRVVVTDEPGTTRDAVDTVVTLGGRRYVLIDTAGVRRRGRTTNPLERHGAVRALGILGRTDLVLLVLDALEGPTEQDARLVGRAWDAGRGIVLLANKWDAMPPERKDANRFREIVRRELPAFASLPILCVSAHTGEGLRGLSGVIRQVEASHQTSLATPALNRALRAAVADHPPPSIRGRGQRLLYATQTGQRPPEVTIFASSPASIPPAYVRYLTTRIGEAFGLVGVPLRLRLRHRRPDDAVTPARGSGAPARRSSPPQRGRAPARRR